MTTPTATTALAITLLVAGWMGILARKSVRLNGFKKHRALAKRCQTGTPRSRRSTIELMLFMVIEQFRNHDPNPVHERFLRDGRMLPDGVTYHASWVDPAQTRCYQLMEAPDLDKVRLWTKSWDDLVDFEIVPVLTSQDYWAQHGHS
jgi:Protein of unknown function (DUF3303)